MNMMNTLISCLDLDRMNLVLKAVVTIATFSAGALIGLAGLAVIDGVRKALR